MVSTKRTRKSIGMKQQGRGILLLGASLLWLTLATPVVGAAVAHPACFVGGSRQRSNKSLRQVSDDNSQNGDIDRDTTKPSFVTADKVGTYYNPFEARDTARAGSSSLSGLSFTTDPSILTPTSNPWAKTGTPRNVLSVRKIQMQQAMVELLEAVDKQQELTSVLESYRDVWLAPFSPDFLDDDPDSIYTPDMGVSERLQTYQKAMEKRIVQARNPSVQKVLQAMNAYISAEMSD